MKQVFFLTALFVFGSTNITRAQDTTNYYEETVSSLLYILEQSIDTMDTNHSTHVRLLTMWSYIDSMITDTIPSEFLRHEILFRRLHTEHTIVEMFKIYTNGQAYFVEMKNTKLNKKEKQLRLQGISDETVKKLELGLIVLGIHKSHIEYVTQCELIGSRQDIITLGTQSSRNIRFHSEVWRGMIKEIQKME